MALKTEYLTISLNMKMSLYIYRKMQEQANMLVRRLNQLLTTEEMNDKWKMITIFIGANDLCDSCYDQV